MQDIYVDKCLAGVNNTLISFYVLNYAAVQPYYKKINKKTYIFCYKKSLTKSLPTLLQAPYLYSKKLLLLV